MQKTLIAIIVCAWPPEGGGIGNNAYYHAQKLAQQGVAVTAYTPAYKGAKVQLFPWLRQLPVWLQNGKAGFMFGLWRELSRHHIIHLYLPFFGTDIIVGLWALMHPRSKLILHYQMDAVGQGWQKFVFALYGNLFFPLLLKRADRIIALSEDHARHSYLSLYYKKYPEKFIFIPNGVDVNRFTLQSRDISLQTELGISPDDQVLMFAGGLDAQHYFKGLKRLMEVHQKLVAIIPNVKLLIAGDGVQRPMYEQLAANLGTSNNVVFAGWISNEQLHHYYALADVFVLPSEARTESFGIVIAEAQACGVPVVVSDWPGSRQTIEHGVTGIVVPPADSEALYESLHQLLTDQQKRRTMGEAARIRAAKLYDWKSVMDKLQNTYQVLAAPRALDLGCGNGDYAHYLQHQGMSAVGVDIDVSTAREKYPQLTFSQMQGDHLDFPDASFDRVYAHDVLEHVENFESTISEVARVLAPSGFFEITVPDERSERMLIASNTDYWQQAGHVRIVTLPVLSKVLADNELSIVGIKREKFFLFVILWLLFRLGYRINSQKGDLEPTPLYRGLQYINQFFDAEIVFRTRARFVPLWLITLPLASILNRLIPKTLKVVAYKK
jgi:rhamnosyl/mannosyltransferase